MFKDRNENLILRLPFGFRDIFPLEVSERRCIEDTIRREFVQWGYGEVKTPVFEYTKNISAGVGKNWKDKLISFFDNDGNLVSLRADMTIPIARLSGMRLKSGQLPARFYYFANSFRQSGFQKGEKRVLEQAGLEFIGAESQAADVEVLSILIKILQKLSVKGFKIGIGHIRLLEGLAEWFELDQDGMEFLRDNLISSDLVSIKDFLTQRDKKKADVFLKLMEPVENIKIFHRIISEIKLKKVYDSFNYLKGVYGVLEELGFSEYLIVDFSIMRQFNYYSGLIFEAYCPKITELIGSGGRYDGLIKKFGLDVPATGFALDVDLLHKALDKPAVIKFKNAERVFLFGPSSGILDMIKLAEKLKGNGLIVELFFDDDSDLESLAAASKAVSIYRPDFKKSTVEITDIIKKIKRIVKIEECIQQK